MLTARRCIPKIFKFIKAVLVIAILATSLHLYRKRTIATKNMYEEFPGLARELAAMAILTRQNNPSVHIHVQRALGYVLTTLREYHGVIPENLVNAAAKAAAAAPEKEAEFAVCPERYLGTVADYPWFEKGRILTNCTEAPPFESVISILLNGHEYANDEDILAILNEIYAVYPRLTVVVGVRKEIRFPQNVQSSVHQVLVGDTPTASEVWNALVEAARTEYVFIARRLQRFLWYALLERMVRVMSELDVAAVGGSIRTPDGRWYLGCQQTTYRNYTVTYKAGYDLSKSSCAYCNYLPSSFVTRKSTMQELTFKMTSSATVFYDLFLRLQRQGKLVMSCPDSMFFVHADNENATSSKHHWFQMAREHGLNHVNLDDGQHLSFSCNEAMTTVTHADGVIVPVCAVEELLGGILRVLDVCRQMGMYCQVEGETALGAMKFNGMLPWVRGASIAYVMADNDYSLWDRRHELFTEFGYELFSGQHFKVGTNVVRRPQYIVAVRDWRILLFRSTRTSLTVVPEKTPTKLLISGRWVNAPSNPGLYARGLYGPENYLAHPETSKQCPMPNNQECLDQYPEDGNVNFIYQ